MAGVAAVSGLIGLVLPRYHIANISMVYLLLVVGLAVYAGSGPAVLASVLAFLAFDWFFVEPVGRLTVSDPNEWLALFLFLVVAVITGGLAAGLQRRAAEAQHRARETTTLYELSTAILIDSHLDHVLGTIATRLLATLSLRNAAILLVDERGNLAVAAEAGEPLDAAGRAEREESAHLALDAGAVAGHYVLPPSTSAAAHDARGGGLIGACAPIALSGRALGVVAAYDHPGTEPLTDERARLLEAFAALTALAVSRARLTEEEERARAAAESDRMKSAFLASVSHDLRTPLTAIKAAAAGLRREAIDRGDATDDDLAAGIDREVDRLNRLVGNLLEMSRIESGALPPRKAPEDLAAIVGTVIARLTPLLATRQLIAVIPDDLPLVPLDAVQFDRVLTNLLENAVKFSPAASTIRLQAAATDSRVTLRVHNQGSSLPEDQLTRIFDKFYQLAPSTSTDRGTGLGLAICKGIVDAHDGSIRAENDADGVSFVVELPLGENETAAVPAAMGVPA